MDFKENFHWINEGKIVIEDDRIIMTAPVTVKNIRAGE